MKRTAAGPARGRRPRSSFSPEAKRPQAKPGGMRAISIAVHNAMEVASPAFDAVATTGTVADRHASTAAALSLPARPVDGTPRDARWCRKVSLHADLNRADQGSIVMQTAPLRA